jgi:hypothetical protein
VKRSLIRLIIRTLDTNNTVSKTDLHRSWQCACQFANLAFDSDSCAVDLYVDAIWHIYWGFTYSRHFDLLS